MERTAAPNGRGRPRLEYTANPAADSRWGLTGPYERLAVLLAEVVRTGDSPEEVGRRSAHRHRLGAKARGEPIAELLDQLARHGFDPVSRERGDTTDVTLRACPFESAALTDPATVCGLHLGLARGIAETVDGLVIDELVAKDPRRANCQLRCHVEHPAAPRDEPDVPALDQGGEGPCLAELVQDHRDVDEAADHPGSDPTRAGGPPSGAAHEAAREPGAS